MRNEYSNCALAFVAAVGPPLALTYSASAWDLSDEDYDYLRKMQSLERYDALVLDLSPKERSGLHYLINDQQPDAVRDKNVKDILGLFLGHQMCEETHSSESWDAPKK
jgi:hypothetical protein